MARASNMRLFTLTAGLAGCLWSGCSSYKARTSSDIQVQVPFMPPETRGLSLAEPTVGLFVGVSEYGERANVYSTPAHTLSAALLYEPFFQAATLSDEMLRKEELGIPDRNYFEDHKSAVCAVAFTSDGLFFVTAARDGSIVARVAGNPEEAVPVSQAADGESAQGCGVALDQIGRAHV